MRRLQRRKLALLLGLLGFAAPCRAEDSAAPGAVSADAVAACLRTHDDARILRLEERWLEAREAMTRCADPACPLAIRSDCSAWLDEVAAALPTLLVVVERDDDGRQPLRIDLDGQLLNPPETFGPIEVLPGKHTLRFSLGTYPPVERTLELEKGEKNHVVHVRFERERPPPAAPPPPPPRRTRPVPVETYLLSGGAIVALTTSSILLASAVSSLHVARDHCAPECHAGERESIDARLLAADIVGGVGLALGGFALYTFVNRPVVVEPRSARSRDSFARPLSADISFAGRF